MKGQVIIRNGSSESVRACLFHKKVLIVNKVASTRCSMNVKIGSNEESVSYLCPWPTIFNEKPLDMLYKHSELILQLRTVRHQISDFPTPLQQSLRFLAKCKRSTDTVLFSMINKIGS